MYPMYLDKQKMFDLQYCTGTVLYPVDGRLHFIVHATVCAACFFFLSLHLFISSLLPLSLRE